ncbi:MAG: DNA mismatch repair protein MutS [Bacillota bacterium]|nr:DNA mismatch repair protein MutS [Bacillota bacterium]
MIINKEKLTPMMKQYFSIKDQYEEYILFYRLGDFYEMFFDDAIIASKALGITLTGRNCGLEERAPLCGVPVKAGSDYLKKLINKGFKVAICEQVEDPNESKGIVKREVVRIVTPGTITEPNMLNDKHHNYILAYFIDDKGYSIAYSDITTGELKSIAFYNIESKQRFIDEILKINPSEILYKDDDLHNEIMSTISLFIEPVKSIIDKSFYKVINCENTIKRVYKVFSLDSYGLSNLKYEKIAIGVLLQYIEETQKVALLNFNQIDVYHEDNFMFLDKFSRRNLELLETIRTKDKKGSLLWVLDKTLTPMGGRRLTKWIEEPLLSKERINDRLNSVEYLSKNLLLKEELKYLMKKIYDLERLSSKLVYGGVNARDLISLKHSLYVLPDIKELLKDINDKKLLEINKNIDILEDIYSLIDIAIVDNPPIAIKDGGIIKASYNDELIELYDIINNGKNWLINKELEEKKRTGINTLKIGYNRVFGYYIEVTKANIKLVPPHYNRKQTLSNSERYITEDLKEIEDKILNAEDKSVLIEYEIFNDIKDKILSEIERIKITAMSISKLDVLIAFASVSLENNYIKPTITNGHEIILKDSRHPVIEKISLNGDFVPNDLHLDNLNNKFLIITGPNMAGKSTYLRQVALITLMAQIGCFVPASYAQIGLVDRIFTRVGASDDLSQGQSTFMVEMSELANILHNSTDRSLIILDEIGRGTSTYDGLSIAWAVVEYLSDINNNSCKNMFATHYHELTELESELDTVKNYYITAKEIDDDIIFLRKIKRGKSKQSYGIQVAKLAGVPERVLKRAKMILKRLEKNDINNNINILKEMNLTDDNPEEIINEKESEIINIIKSIDINKLTPIEAINELYKLKNIANE